MTNSTPAGTPATTRNDTMATVKATLGQRISELAPLVSEHARLSRALAALEDDAPVRRRTRRKAPAAG
jgi:hypothetical protein